jgi:hypothetical protein
MTFFGFVLNRKTKSKKQNQNKIGKKTRKYKGGDLKQHSIFNYIKSIGFEIETTDLIKFSIERLNHKEILVNSALTNIDLEYGYFDENEYTDIIDTPKLKFKITNDSAEDSEFNEEIIKLYSPHKSTSSHSTSRQTKSESDESESDESDSESKPASEKEDCDEVIFKLEIPENEYLKQTTYDIKIREPELHNCASFTDVEWIITYYEPKKSKNVILDHFYDSIKHLKEHLQKLKTINNSYLLYLNEYNEYVNFENTTINQVYVLPGTSLVYYNNSVYDIKNYNINEDLKIVVQMTFSCDINYVFRIMKKLMAIDFSSDQMKTVKKYLKNNDYDDKVKENVENIYKMIDQTMKNENFDLDAIDNSLKIVKKLFEVYEKTNNKYSFSSSENTKKLEMYLFLIIYKLYIYLNSYLQNKEQDRESLFKKSLSFAVRHTNYYLYLEIKRILKEIFSLEDETEIVQIIYDIVRPIDQDKKINNMMYNFPYVKTKKTESGSSSSDHFGDPLYSIADYFSYFEKELEDVINEVERHDWLVENSVDEKSTKFELNNDTIIIEFRDFPSYCFLHLFMESDDLLRTELLKNNIGTLNMKFMDAFI